MVVRRSGRACVNVWACAPVRVCVLCVRLRVLLRMYSSVLQRGAMPSAGAGAKWLYDCTKYYNDYRYRPAPRLSIHSGPPEGTRLSGPPEARRGDRREHRPAAQSEGEARHGTLRAPQSIPCEYSEYPLGIPTEYSKYTRSTLRVLGVPSQYSEYPHREWPDGTPHPTRLWAHLSPYRHGLALFAARA